MFAIEFTDERIEEEGVISQYLWLQLGDFEEGEWADLSCWSIEHYQSQWLHELKETLETRSKGALILSIHDPQHAHRVWVWSMWKRDDQIHFQNRLLFMQDIEDNFDARRVHEYIGEHRLLNEDGQEISNWVLPASAVQKFVTENVRG